MSTDPVGRDEAAVPPAVAQLRKSLSDLIDESQALRSDVHTAESARKRASRINLGVLGMLAIFIVLLLAVTWQNNVLAQRVNETNARVADCTNPGGKCFVDGQKRTGTAISDIIRSEIFMAECSRLYPGESGPDYDQKLEACVAERLTSNSLRRSQVPSPTPARKG